MRHSFLLKCVHDSFGQLIRENNQALDKTFIYSYNEIGNITSVSQYAYTTDATPSGTPTTTTYTYDTTHPDRLISFGDKAVVYNSIGCPSSYNGMTYGWSRGKLSSIGCGSANQPSALYKKCAFTYDGYGRRTHKIYNYDPNPASTSDYSYTYVTTYDYDSSGRLIREYCTERYIGGNTTTRELIFLYDESGIVGVAYSKNGAASASDYFHKNLQGDVIAIYNSNGTKIGEYAYDAFGNCTILSGITNGLVKNNPIRYRSYYFDRETGLYYLNARYYNPEWRRFISPAQIGVLNTSIVSGLNLYCFASNSPINVLYNFANVRGTIPNNNSQFVAPIKLVNQYLASNNTSSFKPLSFSIGLVTPENPKLPKWMNFSAFYANGHLGLNSGYSDSSNGKGGFDLSLASLDVGIVSMKCDIVTFAEGTSLYLGVGALNANASLGLGLSGNVEIVSFYFGATFIDCISMDGKVYVGWGLSLDFSRGIKLGVAVGIGVEISLGI